MAKICCCLDLLSTAEGLIDCYSDIMRIDFVGILDKEAFHLLTVEGTKSLCRRLSLLRIESQIQRTIHLPGEAARRIIDLHRRYTEICQHEIERAEFSGHLVDIAEVGMKRIPDTLIKSTVSHALSRLLDLDGIDIQGSKMTFEAGAIL